MKYTEKFLDGYITVDTKDFGSSKGAFKAFMLVILLTVIIIGIFILGVVLLNVIDKFIL